MYGIDIILKLIEINKNISNISNIEKIKRLIDVNKSITINTDNYNRFGDGDYLLLALAFISEYNLNDVNEYIT